MTLYLAIVFLVIETYFVISTTISHNSNFIFLEVLILYLTLIYM